MIKAFLFRTLGNVMFDINGRLDSINKKNKRAGIMYWAWRIAYFSEEKAMGRL